jgi:hypothetical protein
LRAAVLVMRAELAAKAERQRLRTRTSAFATSSASCSGCTAGAEKLDPDQLNLR